MLSELDNKLRTVLDRLTAPGAPFETEEVERFGSRLAVFRRAPASLPAFFDHFCGEHREKPFLVDGDIRLSFGDVHGLARRAAMGLVARHGVRRGDRIAIAGANSANWIIAYMAILMAGGCATLLNGWSTGEELAEAVMLAECTLVLADPDRAERLRDRAVAIPVVTLAPGEPSATFAGLAADCAEFVELPVLAGSDLATIVFTSGSTGVSKAAFSRHSAVVHAALNMASQAVAISLQAGPEVLARPQAALLTVPLFHVTGEVAVLLQSFVSGRRLVLMRKWSAVDAMRLIERERITFFTGVPLMSHEIATHPDRARYDLTSCVYFAAGGSAQSPEHVAAIRKAMQHAMPLQGYGLTETNCIGCTNYTTNYLAKPDSTGPASGPLVEVAIFAKNGEACPPGAIGEIAIRSICNFDGYWNDPEATAAAVRPDGYFLTGDLGRLDDEGYLYVIDRKKDIIIRGGENIAAMEVERAIYSHPLIAEASVFGLPDEHYGEVPVAVYHAKPGEMLDARELQRHLAERIAGFKIPVQFWQQDQALPRLGAQKVDKRALKERYARMWAVAAG